jgi:hypothetical protein
MILLDNAEAAKNCSTHSLTDEEGCGDFRNS